MTNPTDEEPTWEEGAEQGTTDDLLRWGTDCFHVDLTDHDTVLNLAANSVQRGAWRNNSELEDIQWSFSHRYALQCIRIRVHNCVVDVHRSQQFARWVDDLVQRAKAGGPQALKMAQYVFDELNYLRNLHAEPNEDTATLKRVRQSKRYPVWRLSHPYDPDTAVRIICWFDDANETVVVTLIGADKAPMGDVFYDSVGSRSDQQIDQWKRENEGKRDE